MFFHTNCQYKDVHEVRLAAQIGVKDITIPYPGVDLEKLKEIHSVLHENGLKLRVIERHLPHNHIVHGTDGRDTQIADIVTLIHHMKSLDIDILCYNWMPRDDWSRTSVTIRERGQAYVSQYDHHKQQQLSQLDGTVLTETVTTSEQLWQNLAYFLKIVIPIAEQCRVKLSLHPDDPPVSSLCGQDQIMHTYDDMLKAMSLYESPSNTICFCQGTFASAGYNIIEGIELLQDHISYVHFRDVNGQLPKFTESFQDNGKTNMKLCIQTYLRVLKHNVPIRPDHVPTLESEDNSRPGYHMLGRLFAIGYIKGLMEFI